MATNIAPGPIVKDVLYSQDKHISEAIWNEGTEKVKKVRNFNHVPIINDGRVLNYIYDAGFYGLYSLMFVKIDHPLITALIERWRPETHTFHFTVGECTITLQDVEVLAGAKIDGLPLIRNEKNSSLAARKSWVGQWLGMPNDDSFTRDGALTFKWLEDNFNPVDLTDESTDDMVRRVARACILRILGSQFLQDKQGTGVQLYYLPFLEDFDTCGAYSWGSAILAYLYRSLCNVASGKSEQVNGALILLQIWAWTRLTQIRPCDGFPSEQPPFEGWPRYPYGHRWASNALKYDKGGLGHSLRVYRDQFDQMSDDQVIWEPYESVIDDLPEMCTDGQDIWRVRVPLICIDVVEWHYPDRVLRQFGMMQGIPPTTIRNDKLHDLSRKGNPTYNWLRRHETYVGMWTARAEKIVQGAIHNGIETVMPEYYPWYNKITRRLIGSTATRPPSRGIQPTAARMELLYEGLCEHYKLFVHHEIAEGVQDCLNRFAALEVSPPDIEITEASHPSGYSPGPEHQSTYSTGPSHIPEQSFHSSQIPVTTTEGPSSYVDQLFSSPYVNPYDQAWSQGGLPVTSHTRARRDVSTQSRRPRRGRSETPPTEEEPGSSQQGHRGYRPVSGFYQ